MEEREDTLERGAQGDAAESVHEPVETGEAPTGREHTENGSSPDAEPAGSEIAIATPLEGDDDADAATDDEEIGSGGNGRFITAIGAAVLLVGMFLAWYEVVRSNGYTVNTTGWQTFTKLRFVLLLGSAGCLLSVLM